MRDDHDDLHGDPEIKRRLREDRAGPPTPRSASPFHPAHRELSDQVIIHKTAACGKSASILDDIPAYPDDNPKTVVGMNKPSTAGIPPAAMIHLGGAMADGIKKYGKFNWRDKQVTASVYTDAIERHMMAFKDGEDCARDSGRHHLAHVMACCAILLDAEACDKLIDDRGPPGPAADMIDALTDG